MNERIVAIARELARSDRTLSLESLASEYEVSSRTIRNDVKSLNLFLSEKGLEPLEYGPGGVIVVPPDFPGVLSSLPVQGFYSYKLSSDERKTLAVVIMALEPGFVTLAAIADRFSVSRSTVLNDLDGIKAVAQEAGLEVVSRPNRGLKVVGDEPDLRGFLLNFMLTKPALAEQWSSVSSGMAGKADEVTIDKILNEQCRLHKAVLDDRAFRTVSGYLAIAVQRCRDGMRMKGDWVAPSESQEALSFARDVISLLSQYCGVGMGEGEAESLSSVLESSGFRSDAEFTIEDVQVQTVTRKFVQNVSLACGVDLNGDYSLFECLSNHLETMFSSDASRFPVNPVLREVVTDQPQVLDVVKDNLQVLEEYSRRRITEVETIYVALHICAALERRKNRERRLRVVVVCDEGVGTSRLVVEDLRGRFDIRVIKVIPAHEAPYLGSYHADLVISTVALHECPVNNVVALLPFSDRDYERIREKIDEVRSFSDGAQDGYDELGAQGLLDKIEPILRRELPGGSERVIREVRTEVRRYFHEAQHMEEEILTPYLHQLLPASHIQLDVEASDWRDAIAKSAQPLVTMGHIEPRYIQAMIENVERHGPYVVLVPHFAIPHEAPEYGVYKMGMNLIRLRTPVRFDADDHDPVEFVCTLAPVDHKSHLKAFFNLLSMLTKPELTVFQELRDARTPEEAASALETAEYQIIQ